MADFVSATIQTAYYALGHCVPTILTSAVEIPLRVVESLSSTGVPRQDRWLIAASAGNNQNYLKLTHSDTPLPPPGELRGIFDSMSFFGHETNPSPRYSANGFTNQQYPYPLFSGHYHTIMGGARKSVPSKKMHYEREVVQNTKFDNNTLYLDWRLCDAAQFTDGPKGVIVVVPGLCSGPNTSYMQRFVLHCNRNGFHVVVLHNRGTGSAPLDHGNMTSGLFTHDIDYVVEEHLSPSYLATRFGDEKLKVLLVGFSLGGAMVTNHLGRTPCSRAYCAVAAEAPWDFHASTAMMGTRFARAFYQPALMRGLWNVVKKTGDNMLAHATSEVVRTNLTMLKGKMKKKGGMKGYTVYDFDCLVTGPMQGFPSASAYYSAASPFQQLPKVTVPLLCFSAMDDPITGPPPALAEWNGVCNENHNILHVRCPSGGHLGFMRGPVDEFTKGAMVPGYMDECIVKALLAAVANAEMLAVKDKLRTTSAVKNKI